MLNINYSPSSEKSDLIPDYIIELIHIEDPFFSTEYNDFKLRTVESPFIIADNDFDLGETNNTLIEIGVKQVKQVVFTGGCIYTEYVKDGHGIIVHGNGEEGFNIFILK